MFLYFYQMEYRSLYQMSILLTHFVTSFVFTIVNQIYQLIELILYHLISLKIVFPLSLIFFYCYYTWTVTTAATVGDWFAWGLNLIILGRMAAMAVPSEWAGSMGAARSDEKDLKLEQLGREATGLVIIVFSISGSDSFTLFICIS